MFNKSIKAIIATFFIIPFVFSGCDDTARSLTYPAPPDSRVPIINADHDRLIEVDANGKKARAIFTRNGKKLVVLLHGNACTINAMSDYARRFHQIGYSTLLIEYPGYGISSDETPSEKMIYRHTCTLLSSVQKNNAFNREDVLLFGQSLGTGVAMELASRKLAGKVILVSPFTSMKDVARFHYPDLLVSIILSENYDSLSKAPLVDVPVLIIHGEKDRVVPHHMGMMLHNKLKHSSIISIHGAGHNDIHYYFDSKLWKKIISFIKTGNQQLMKNEKQE